VGDEEKLLTYLNSALKALLGFDIFPRVPKKSEILLPSVIGLGSNPSFRGERQPPNRVSHDDTACL
jgi:hypothetical protein